ncbi:MULTISPECIES: aminoacyl-tRNA deacylase [Fictibacillus]|uniref:aminoacyl-tRNA deacylase n=1 Tax=Fictibacillus TaxID=1329200 RepID=UPI00102969F9|nr:MULTISPECIES: YbaK/EbsC family protein [Fictibacillus]RZT22699.1 prolyl-tRNA editing enzyme YbaK/EbsC (Cys-tRNA(Pro) deacylase) [Fictibacillus sp. BK138]
MEKYENMLKKYIQENNLSAEHYRLSGSCHSVEEAAQAMQAPSDLFVKNICLIDENKRLIVAIVKGKDRASTTLVGKVLNISKPRLANEIEILEYTGFPVGGVPSFGYKAVFLVDPKVTEQSYIYTGGGSANSLIKISVEEMLEINEGLVVKIRR